MKLTLQRIHANSKETFGKLFIDGVFFCYTLEDVVREIIGKPVAEWKIKEQTAIPSTSYVEKPYKIVLEYSGKFGAATPTVKDVPGYTYVRIHPGNTEKDTEGCILVGYAIDDNGIKGGTSRPAWIDLKKRIVDAIGNAESVTLEISNIVEAA